MKSLLPFQAEVLPLIGERNVLLADDCGLGKTIIAIEAAKAYAQGPILVICPRGVKQWWAQEIAAQEAGEVYVTGPAGRGLPTNLKAGRPLQWVITHPEGVRMAVSSLKQVAWDWIVADEAHRFKNRKAAQTKALWQLRANKLLALTATPYGRSPADLWALLHWLYPKVFTSYWKFVERFVETYKPHGAVYSIFRGPKNLSEMARQIAPFYCRRAKTEVAIEFPPLVYSDVPVLINGTQGRLYRTLQKEAYEVLAGQEVILENALIRLIRLHQCALDPGLMVDTGFMFPTGEVPAKVAWLVEWLEDHPDEPVIIVSRYRKFVEQWLMELSPDACIVGGMSEKAVQEALRTFERTGRLVGSLAAVCEGLNLQKAATIIVTDGTYSVVQEYQLAQRIHRIGQDKPCQVIHLVGKLENGRYTVDNLIRQAMARRVAEAELVDMFVKEVTQNA